MLQFEQLISSDLKRQQEERELRKRDYVYASEIGTSLVDCFLSMKGVEPTNPPDERALRTMSMGHVFEDYVAQLLPKDVKVEREVSVQFQHRDYLPIHGRIDFIIDDEIVELKTVNSRSFWYGAKSESGFQAYPHHILQLYTYMLAKGLTRGHIVYVSKDDMSIEQLTFEVTDDDTTDKLWNAWMSAITQAIKTDTQPAMEEKMFMENGKWRANWHVTRSRYLTKLTGIKDPKEIDNEVRRLNYAIAKEEKKNGTTKSS